MHSQYFLILHKPLFYLLRQVDDHDQLVFVNFTPLQLKHHLRHDHIGDHLITHSQVQQSRQEVHALGVPNLRVKF